MLTPHQFRDNNKGNEEGKERKKVLLGDAFGFFDFDFFWICFGWFRVAQSIQCSLTPWSESTL